MASFIQELPLHVGFVSTRFNGTDGVSLEAEKWATVLESMGHTCFYFAGESDRHPDRSIVVAEASFKHPAIEAINDIAFVEPWGTPVLREITNTTLSTSHIEAFSSTIRPPRATARIREIAEHLKLALYEFTRQFQINLLLVENALAIPMNIPLGVALTEFIAETGFPTIAHHHDFYWERKRYLVNCVSDYLRMCFPPDLPSIRHVTISSWAARQLSLETGVSAVVVPNVMDFENPPHKPDGYTASLRADLGVAPDERLILQPTRVVQRKGIEHAIELVKRLSMKAHLVISHASGDEGDSYEQRVRAFARLLDVPTSFVSDQIGAERGLTADGRKVYALADVYHQADLVTFPSSIEGFGNAFLEAMYYERPLVVNNYSIYAIEIRPKGIRVIEFDGFISNQTVAQAEQVLASPELAEQITGHNYALATRYYSYSVLCSLLQSLLEVFPWVAQPG